MATVIELAGWVFNTPGLHLLGPRIAVGGCTIWSYVLLFTRRNAGRDRPSRWNRLSRGQLATLPSTHPINTSSV